MNDFLLEKDEKLLNYKEHKACHNYVFDNDSNCGFSLHAINKEEKFVTQNKNCVVFVLCGKVQLDSEDLGTKIFEKDNMFFISANSSLCRGIALENTEFIILIIDYAKSLYDKLLFDNLAIYCPAEIVELEGLRIHKLLRYFLEGVVLYLRNDLYCRHMHNLKESEFFFIIRAFYEKEQVARFLSPLIFSQNNFKSMVLAKYTNTCSVEELASKCNMTSKTLTRRFKEQFDTTPYQWLIQQKHKYIKISLAQGASMQKVSDDFGFASVAHFMNYYKKYIE